MDYDQMFALLQSEEAESQREGAFMAGELKNKEAIPLLTTMLTSPNLGVQDAADMSLRKIGGRESVEALLPLLRSENVPARNLAMDILRQIGSQYTKPIIALLRDPDSDIRIFAADILGSTNQIVAVHPLCETLLTDNEVNVRYQAAVSLGTLGRPEAVEALNKALGQDEWVNFAVIEALMKIGGDASITSLIRALDKSSELVASIIIDALGELGHIRALPVLVNYLDKPVPALRNKILKAVVNIMGSKGLALVSDEERTRFAKYLLKAADDADQEILDAVILGLSCIGGEDASRKVLSLIVHIDPQLEPDRYANALSRMAVMGLTNALIEASQSDDEKVSLIAIEVLIRLGTPEAITICMDVFWDKRRDLQRIIAKAVSVSMCCDQALPFFRRVLHESLDGDLLKSALHFLGIHTCCRDSLQEIVPFLRHKFNDVKEAALDACVALGGKDVEEIFVAMLQDDDATQRMMGLHGLGRLDADSHKKAFEKALDDTAVGVRKVALAALITPTSKDKELLTRIAERMILDESTEVRRALVSLLGVVDCRCTLPLLVKALDDEDTWVQIRAVESLGLVGREDALPALETLLERDNLLVRIKVAKVLGQIGGKKAFGQLLKILKTEDSEVQRAAEQALAQMQASDGEVL